MCGMSLKLRRFWTMVVLWSQFHQRFLRVFLIQNFGTKNYKAAQNAFVQNVGAKNMLLYKKCTQKTLMKLTPDSLIL